MLNMIDLVLLVIIIMVRYMVTFFTLMGVIIIGLFLEEEYEEGQF